MNLSLLNGLLKERNEKHLLHKYRLLKCLFNRGPQTVSTLCDDLGMSPPSVLKLINSLAGDNLIEKKGLGLSIGGRRPDLYGLVDGKILIFCIDIQLFHTKITIIENNHNVVVDTKIINLPITMNRSDFLNILNKEIQKMMDSERVDRSKLIGCSVGIPGLIDTDKGENYSYLLDSDQNIPLATAFENVLQLPVVIQNDVNGSSMAELSHGLAKGKKNVLILLMDWGVGLGIIMDGMLRKGACGFSGELGHIPVVENGELCYCGKHGCLETIASGNALSKMAKSDILSGKNSMLNQLSPEELERIEPDIIIKAANKGDQYAIQLLSNVGAHMGKGISILIQLFNPELIILSGQIAAAKQYITLPMQQAINTYCMTQIREKTIIVTSELGETSRLLGYAMQGINEILDAYIKMTKLTKATID
ncbi:ROK family transcriptional regulator [Pedobacter insulae]|uniref:Sugar kinase of the NBD/HSP70 family, may contain an N-terminal HTH domain n=1 Tax=Pedobacter insulae TaxID=414048 RepID=A0A1I2YL76_9SPHI|nr:ROK family transcriptional regulator [Pedobacter insulae]SFH26405.1 Sugar kinase of the NBD/HSP70 family, may contain an N-terminal HTH domain [Pedobacter insulae]